MVQTVQIILLAIALMITAIALGQIQERMKQQDARLDRIERHVGLPESKP